MKKKQIKKLFNIDLKTQKIDKNLKNLLLNLDFNRAEYLIKKANKQIFVRLLENEKYFEHQLDFEKELYALLVDRDIKIWKKLANGKSLSKQARLRSAYLYSYLSKKPLKLNFDIEKYRGLYSFFHKTKGDDGDGYARIFGLKNGLDNIRFNQYKNTGGF